MSCLVGLIDGKDIWLGCEGLASSDNGDIRGRSHKKIFRNGDYVIGFVGSVRSGQILQEEYFIPPKKISDLPDAIREQCAAKGCMGSDENQMEMMLSNYLVVFEGRLYEVLTDFHLYEVTEYSSVGAGANFAIGSLYTTKILNQSAKVKIPAEVRVKLALNTAIEFNAACGGKLTIEKF